MRIVIREQSPIQDTIITLLALLLAAGAGYFWFALHNVKFAVGLAVGALIALMFQGYSVQNSLIILIDETGVLDHRLGIGRIPWEDIENVQIGGGYGNRVLSLRLRQPERYIERLPNPQRAKVDESHDLGFKHFTIDLKNVDLDLLDLKQLIERRIAKQSG